MGLPLCSYKRGTFLCEDFAGGAASLPSVETDGNDGELKDLVFVGGSTFVVVEVV
ncbi:hypothetical protein [Mucilaginibacter psychrotolerans]|uniref:hypothetical protein n=1 Tax=Mucilaginibacter psychrotolerans TaxID=1524096 RepID=UPI001305237F|nr:hypothetical protein [Mucilaginibacter psychrotolerans]